MVQKLLTRTNEERSNTPPKMFGAYMESISSSVLAMVDRADLVN